MRNRRPILGPALIGALLLHAVVITALLIADSHSPGRATAPVDGSRAATTVDEAASNISQQPPEPADVADDKGGPEAALLALIERQFTGDLKAVRTRRVLRALVSYSKTNFFYDGGRKYGYEYEKLRQLEEFLNRGVSDRLKRIHVVVVPTAFDQLIPALVAGRGDIAASGLTVTAARQREVAFTKPYLDEVREIVVSHKHVTGLSSLQDLAGRGVYVRRASSYVDHLSKLNRRLEAQGRASMHVHELESLLATEDILQLVNAGALELTVADEHIARAWAQVLPDIALHPELSINSGGRIAWAVRKDNPELLAALNRFVDGHKKGSRFGNIVFNRYYRDTKWIKNPVADGERKKLEQLETLFKKYADRYGFDWLAIAAQAYQESGLDQGRVSRSGAVGVMQIKPSTAADPAVGIANVHKLENNIHAGVKYLHHVRNAYFGAREIDPFNQMVFSWAAYNAGPTRIQSLRQLAARKGLDPNRWFNHVERVAAQQVGREPVDYVSNIYKYYVAYRLGGELLEEKYRKLQRFAAG